MNIKAFTYLMEAAMHNLQYRKPVRAALAACLVLGSASLAAADAAKAPAADKAAEAVKANETVAVLAAKEQVTREENEADAAAARDAARQFCNEGKYEQAIAEYLRAKKIWEGRQTIEPAKYTRDIEAMKKEISQAYYYWAKDLHIMAEKDASVNKLDDAIAKCRQAAEMYEPCKDMMEKAIAKYEAKKRAMEFAAATTTEAADPEGKERKDQLELYLQRGRAYYKIGRWDDARTQFNLVLAQDPYNSVAIDYMRRIYLKMIAVGQQRKELVSAESQNEASWRLIAPILVTAAQSGEEEAGTQVQAKVDATKTLRNKLQQIKFKTLVFEDTPLDEVVRYLKRRSQESDEDKEGVNFVLRFNDAAPVSSGGGEDGGDDGEDFGGDEETTAAAPAEMPPITIYFGAEEDGDEGEKANDKENLITLEKVIEAICQSAELNYRVEEYAVVIAPKSVPLDDYVTEFYTVEKEAIEGSGAEDIKSYFESRGIPFGEGANAVYDEQTNKLIVVNTPAAQARVEQLVNALNHSDPQIQVQVKFMEISMNDLEELGFEYIVSREDLRNTADIQGNLTEITEFTNQYELDGTDAEGNPVMTLVSRYWTNNTGGDVTIYKSSEMPTATDNLGAYSNTTKLSSGATTHGEGKVFIPLATNEDAIQNTKWYYISDQRRTKHSVTWLANDNTVRNASSDPLAFGRESSATSDGQLQDTIFDWTRYSSSGVSMNAKIHALDQADSTDILSSPRLTTMNNQTATIKMVTAKYYPDSWGESELDNVNGLSIFIPSIPEFSDPVEEGIQLEVTPEIADDNKERILMNMNPVILDFAGWTDYSYTVILGDDNQEYSNILKMPIIQARSVSTNVVCADKATIVLGGVVKDKVSIVEDQYPILGDIPIVGRLFQSKGQGSKKTNLLIFLTTTLVNSDGSLYRDEGVVGGVPQF